MIAELSNYTPWIIAAASGGAASAVIGWTSVAPTCELWGKVIPQGPPDQPHIAITFDDGPTPGATGPILDILAETKTPAAFFVIGANANAHPDLVKRMHDEGHIVANHTWDHSHLGCLRGPRYWANQIQRTNITIEQIIGHLPAFFRPPLGIRTPFVTAAAKRADQKIITWSRRGMDGVATTPQRICNRLAPAEAGEILILHDGVEPRIKQSQAATVAALRPLIQTLRSRGLQPLRLDKLINQEPYLTPEPAPCSV